MRPSNHEPRPSRLGLATVREIHEPVLSTAPVPEMRSDSSRNWFTKASVCDGEGTLVALRDAAMASQYLPAGQIKLQGRGQITQVDQTKKAAEDGPLSHARLAALGQEGGVNEAVGLERRQAAEGLLTLDERDERERILDELGHDDGV
jgi:hypothetical protein